MCLDLLETPNGFYHEQSRVLQAFASLPIGCFQVWYEKGSVPRDQISGLTLCWTHLGGTLASRRKVFPDGWNREQGFAPHSPFLLTGTFPSRGVIELTEIGIVPRVLSGER